ncbi:hypothetical protein [Streptomyces sp. SID8499]|nr:hypothetical protein [Streptomyces sp. SID8499]
MSEQSPDLTSPENVAAGEQVYQQIEAGEVASPADVTAALNQAYGLEG